MLKNITYISAAKNKKKEKSLPAGRISWRISQTAGIILLFLFGVTAGTFFINIFWKGGYEELGTYSTYFIDRFSECSVNKKELFFYSFAERSREILVLLILAFTTLGNLVCNIYLLYKGLTVGILISVYVMQYGSGGMLLYGISIFPHYITYIVMIIILVSFVKEIQKEVRVENVSKKEIASRIMKKKLGIYLRCLLLIFALNILTAYLEAFVNFDIMKKILQ